MAIKEFVKKLQNIGNAPLTVERLLLIEWERMIKKSLIRVFFGFLTAFGDPLQDSNNSHKGIKDQTKVNTFLIV